MSARTSTGRFLIGFRRVGSEWQNDPGSLAQWAIENRFGFVDLAKKGAPADLTMLAQAGLRAGSVDLLDFEYLVESYAALVPTLGRTDSRVVIEGWPGPGAVCCTPETYRAFFREVGSDRFGVNYDPSHLLRMGIDPLRFLKEFAGRVFHVHAKDTAISCEDLYEFGHEQPATFAKLHGWGGAVWRYTLPGHGQTDWVRTFRVLKETGFDGLASIELEDENFNGTEAGEQRGLIQSRDFLAGC